MKQMKRAMIMGMMGTLMILPMNAESASCAGGAGVEFEGNDHGTYCRSVITMNWWSAHAWCDAIGMKLMPMEECECRDESNCDMTKQCPNLYVPSQGHVYAWTATPSSNSGAYRFLLSTGAVLTDTTSRTAGGFALCSK